MEADKPQIVQQYPLHADIWDRGNFVNCDNVIASLRNVAWQPGPPLCDTPEQARDLATRLLGWADAKDGKRTTIGTSDPKTSSYLAVSLPCPACKGSGKADYANSPRDRRCEECRGAGRVTVKSAVAETTDEVDAPTIIEKGNGRGEKD